VTGDESSPYAEPAGRPSGNVRTVPSLHDRYGSMVLMRLFEEACAAGVRDGDIRGEMHLAIGQEAAAAGMLGSLRDADWVVGTHRSHPAALAKGIDPYPLMAEVFEKRTGICGGKGGHLHLFSRQHRFSTTGIVGSSLPVALGHAYAARLEDEPYVGVGLTGDGGTNTGQFHETLNMAAIWRLPLVIVVENNGYGISVPAAEVVALPGIVGRAHAYGAWGERADGTDVEAVAEVMRRAFDHARSGAGPALVEVICSRYSGHYEGDPDQYRSVELKQQMRLRAPLTIARERLVERDGLTTADLDGTVQALRQRVDDVLARVRADPAPEVSTARTGVFVEAVRG